VEKRLEACLRSKLYKAWRLIKGEDEQREEAKMTF
jgi:hypothetical protein